MQKVTLVHVPFFTSRAEEKNKEVFEKTASIYQSQEINNVLNSTFKGTIEAEN
ncbi:hypothetical protein L4C38_01775 [Vibrio kasasachensis]|uniref:hypothetical protein n=1 Tax=Vibrio kasasachensis TaxID=2910248 RepID=UPI003D14C275